MKMLKNGIIVELEEMEDYIIEEMNKWYIFVCMTIIQ
jgi:hypothetical protein